MVDGCCNGSGHTGEANFTNTTRAERVEFEVGKVEEMHFNGWCVGIYRNDVVGQVTIDWRAVLRVVIGVLEKSHANSHHHCSLNLVAARQWIEDASGVNN